MTKKEFLLRERALTLYSTGKFHSRAEAMIEAIAEQKREELKKQSQTEPNNTSSANEDNYF